MSDEIKEEVSNKEAPKTEEAKKPTLHRCNMIPNYYIFLQNSGEFKNFDSEDNMKAYMLDMMKEMKDVFNVDELKDKPISEVLKEYDTKFLEFLKEIQKQLKEMQEKKEEKELKIDPKYDLFDKIGRIITNFSVVSVALPDVEGTRIIISKSLFYHYLELMAATSKMGILEMSAIFSTASYSDGSLTISYDEKIPKEQRKADFVKPFFCMGVDGISKGISFQFCEAKNDSAPEKKADKPVEEK